MPRILGAVGMFLGGAVLAGVTAASQVPVGVNILLPLAGLGLTLIAAASWFVFPRASLIGRVLALGGSVFWVLSWTSPLLMGWVFPIPFAVWAGLAALLFALSAVIYAVRRSASGFVFGLCLALGSAGSMIVLLQDPVYSPFYSDVPYALAAIFTATLSFFSSAERGAVDRRMPNRFSTRTLR